MHMEHQEFDAPEALRDVIKCFWHNRIDFGEEPASFEVVPDGYAEIIFHFGSACHISYQGEWQQLPSPFLMGLLNQPALVSAKDRLEILGIRCYPWTVLDLLGLPSGKDGVQVFEHPIAQLQSPLNACMEAGRVEEAIAQVEQFFLKTQSGIGTDDLLSRAGGVMREANGTLPVSEVATAAHATVRTLERKFKQSSGYTVKDVSGLMRFEQVRNQLWLNPDANIAVLAQELGYTDQSHLSREFKRYSGTTPAAFARKARKGKQALRRDFVAFVQS
jgi:AraC-like DNA-binding protein